MCSIVASYFLLAIAFTVLKINSNRFTSLAPWFQVISRLPILCVSTQAANRSRHRCFPQECADDKAQTSRHLLLTIAVPLDVSMTVSKNLTLQMNFGEFGCIARGAGGKSS